MKRPATDFRTGRIKVSASGSQQIASAQKKQEIRYRIYNTGDDPFDVKDAKVTTAFRVKPECSIDLVTRSKLTVNSVNSKPADGIYDVIVPGHDIRSGRIKTNWSKGDAPVQILGTDSTAKGVDIVRVLNSGDVDIDVIREEKPSPQTFTLKKDCAIDLLCETKLEVKPNGSPAAAEIAVIYESLTEPKVRSGRVNNVVAALAHPIIQLSDADNNRSFTYRFLNAGNGTIQLGSAADLTKSANILAEVKMDQSVDISLVKGDEVYVGPKTSGDNVKLIFDLISDRET